MLISVCLLCIWITLVCSTQVYANGQQCRLYYHQENNSLAFDYCQPDAINNNYSSNSWQICCNTCCKLSFSESPSFDAATLAKCINGPSNSNEPPPVFLIIMSVIASLIGLLFLGFIIYRLIIKMQEKMVFPTSKQKDQEDIIASIRWVEDAVKGQENMMTTNGLSECQDSCAVCLDLGPNARLSCSHWYHFKCLLAWISRSKDCPLCRTTKISEIKVYCSNCSLRYTIISFQNILRALNGLQNLSGKCDLCQAAPNKQLINENSFQIFQKEEAGVH